MAWTIADIPDLSGRVAVVTGANGGLGLEAARALAGAGAHVVMAARNQDKAARANDDILASHPDASLEIVELDLASQASVKQAAAAIAESHPVVDVLMCNAGLMALPERRTEDGYEMQFGVNQLGHWTLTALLLPNVLRAERGRIVTLSSVAKHTGRPIDPSNPHLEGKYGPWKAYGNSKLANFHFAMGLQRRFEEAGVRAEALAAHPGLTNSDLQAHSAEEQGGFFSKASVVFADLTGMSTADGARSQLRAATDPGADGGDYFGPRFVSNGAPVRKPLLRRIGLDAAIDRLFEVCERETGVAIDVPAAAAAAN